MMATEATAAKPVDVSVNGPSLTHSASTTKSDAQNVNPSSTPLNGPLDEIENKQITDIVDELVNSAEVSVSGGSDTEASKGDPSLRSADAKDHVRTSSTAARPKSFKSVSVNKTFLAAKGASNSASRPESATGSASSTPAPGTSTSSASRLKLVAKSGSSLGGSTKTLSSNGKSGAPDGSSVWNRNKPAPTPEPKKLSDEEIMNQFNIHIADRLRPEDDAKGQANWADMEDEEEWAPETITWTDGTQVTLPHVDEHATSPAPAPASVAKQPETQPKSKSPAPTAPSTTSAAASPPVKPGVLASGKGLVLKGAPEKPTLVAKPPAPPAPVKSPWAPLPPIDRASPAVVMDLPHQGYQGHPGHPGHAPRGPQRDAAGPKSMTPPLTKEIAADDFSRATWREGPANPSRELFNSQSGRYEPVFDRRGSRHDIPGRQPSLLQRPPHHDHQGPPEPSAGFQSRSGGPEGPYPYGRRRGSSNVSGGSGSVAHRLGRPHDIPPPDGLQVRTGPISGMDHPPSNRPFSPASSHATPRTHYSQPWQPRHSPSEPHANLHYSQPIPDAGPPPPVNPASASTDEDTIQLQKKIMRERREAAMKRRLEEEEREEAAKKERLRLKLEALGPAPERKSAKKDEQKDESPSKAYQPPQQREAGPPTSSSSTKASSPPQKPDIPATVVEKENEKIVDTIPTAEAQVNGGAQAPFNQPRPQGQPPQTGLPKAQSTAPWPEAPQSQKPTPYWSGAPPRNVWGAPGNDRSLGNGTFNAGLGPLAGSHHDPVSAAPHHPAPIGTPRNASQVPHAHAEPAAGRLAPIGPPRGRHAPSGTQGQQQMSTNPWKNVDIASEDRVMAIEARVRNEAHLQQVRDQGLGADAMGPSTIDTWREVRRDETGKRVPVGTSVKSLPNPAARGDHRNSSWNNTPGSIVRDPQSTVAPDREEASQLAQAHLPNGVAPEYGRQPPVGPAVSSTTSQSRGGSRFFPSSRLTHQEELASQQSLQQPRSGSPSPPPPTMEDHPVYSGNPERPHVALPPPRPQVKLPPSVAQSDHLAPIAPPTKNAPISFAAAAATPVGAPLHSPTGKPPSQGLHGHPQKAHEFASQQKWQDKINHLMGKESAPSRSMAVEVASRQNLDHMSLSSNESATVSLPSLSFTQFGASEVEFTTRRMGEECFEEQEMGSLPPVHLPHEAPDALWHASPVNWQGLAQKFRVEASNAEDFRFGPEWLNGKTIIRILTPGSEPKTLPWSLRSSFQSRTKSNPRRPPQRGGGRHPSRGGHRGREDPSDLPSGLSSERPPSNRSNRGGFRGRSENWGRQNTSTSTIQT